MAKNKLKRELAEEVDLLDVTARANMNQRTIFLNFPFTTYILNILELRHKTKYQSNQHICCREE